MTHPESNALSEEYIQLKEEVVARRKIIEKHASALRALIETCTHEETNTKTTYFGGSYLDRASTTYDTYCVLCNKHLHEKTVTHDYFG